jgi:predicted DNA-binding transcriptional regulator AlpA
MTLQNSGNGAAMERLLTPPEAAKLLRLSVSWLAKSRMQPGDGPPFIRIGRAIRYSEMALQEWLKSRQC